jgi:two-component system chemotaxis response regulator CheB
MIRPARDVVVIGGSAGGVAAVRAIVRALPRDCTASILVAMHRYAGSSAPEALTSAIASETALATVSASDEQLIEPAHVYVAPPDRHMVLDNDLIRLQPSPLEHRFRPCVDVLFKTAATNYGRRVVGVLVSGGLAAMARRDCGKSSIAAGSRLFRTRTMPNSPSCR